MNDNKNSSIWALIWWGIILIIVFPIMIPFVVFWLIFYFIASQKNESVNTWIKTNFWDKSNEYIERIKNIEKLSEEKTQKYLNRNKPTIINNNRDIKSVYKKTSIENIQKTNKVSQNNVYDNKSDNKWKYKFEWKSIWDNYDSVLNRFSKK